MIKLHKNISIPPTSYP